MACVLYRFCDDYRRLESDEDFSEETDVAMIVDEDWNDKGLDADLALTDKMREFDSKCGAVQYRLQECNCA